MNLERTQTIQRLTENIFIYKSSDTPDLKMIADCERLLLQLTNESLIEFSEELNQDAEITRAIDFMIRKHASHHQKRRYSDLPYCVHPLEVFGIVRQFGGTNDQCVTALLHDTVEDTDTSFDEISDMFSEKIAEMVKGVTEIHFPEPRPNREVRKEADFKHYTSQDGEIQTVKCADICSNSSTILASDPGFCRKYVPEISRLLIGLDKGNPQIRSMAARQIIHYLNSCNFRILSVDPYVKQLEELAQVDTGLRDEK